MCVSCRASVEHLQDGTGIKKTTTKERCTLHTCVRMLPVIMYAYVAGVT